MRILHTSDWHLGRSFGPVSLAAEQQAFIDWLVAQTIEQRIDLVVVAGDVFDRSVAPIDAVVMFREALMRLLETGAKVAVITGNHDSPDRVAAYDDLLDLSGVYVRGGYSRFGEVLRLPFVDGPLDLVLLPFLDPQAAPDELDEGGIEPEPDDLFDTTADDSVTEAFARRVRRTHRSVLAAAIAAAVPRLSAPRSLAVAHAFVTGCITSESERQLTVGGTGAVEAALFKRFSYSALGHLHRPQEVSARRTVRYAGTPLAYSFSETHVKSIVVIDMAADGTCVVHTLPIPVGRAVRIVTGTIDQLLRAEPDAALAASFVRAVVTDPGVVLDAKQRLAVVYPHVVEIVLDPPKVQGATRTTIDQRTMSATDAADAFWLASVGTPPTPDEEAVLHEAIFAADSRVA